MPDYMVDQVGVAVDGESRSMELAYKDRLFRVIEEGKVTMGEITVLVAVGVLVA
jgi:hypothetical protein